MMKLIFNWFQLEILESMKLETKTFRNEIFVFLSSCSSMFAPLFTCQLVLNSVETQFIVNCEFDDSPLKQLVEDINKDTNEH